MKEARALLDVEKIYLNKEIHWNWKIIE